MRDDGAGWLPWLVEEAPWKPAPGRWRRHVILAGVLAAIQVIGAVAAKAEPPAARPLDVAGVLLLVAGPAALIARHRFPAAVLAVNLAVAVAYPLAGYPRAPFFLAATVALFTAVVAGRRTAAWVLVQVAYLAYLGIGWFCANRLGLPASARPEVHEAVVVALWILVVFVLAEAARIRGQHYAEITRTRVEQARARAEQERRQASEERLRIARELHDVLGHHLSLINVQAGVGLHLMDSRPEQAREALTAIRTASAEALREVRGVLGVLRPEQEAAPRAPAPTLDRLAELTADAGIPVRTRVRGIARPLPAEVDRAGYRIVQEALTNVRRHAGPAATALVTIGYDDDALAVRVDDDGRGAAAPVDEAGNGIAGMWARAAALGGTLTAGPLDGGGFRVDARLPTGDES
ncbi:sensor histidine kinase [Polymorphospora sp. NPDC050346]|uniref:sensor histidine kinase n=1 Tax=Polymorphospora sp. NPDC050346 TaxID=3155780 RepID=UPI0033CD10BD